MWRLSKLKIRSTIAKLDCRLVVFREPYNLLGDRAAAQLFCDILNLKMQGYRAKHDSHVLPIDAYDFLATHLVICTVREDGSICPINAYKSISCKMARKHSLAFPAVNLLSSCVERESAKALADSLNRQIETEELHYNGSWAMHPQFRKDEDVRAFLQEATLATLVQYYQAEKRLPVISAAVTRFGVDRWKETIGFEDIQMSGKPVPRFHTPVFSNSELRFMVLNQVSPEGLQHADDYAPLWRDRQEISQSALEVAAAA